MATSDTERRSSLFWLVTGYILTITLLVVIGAGLYFFAGDALGAPAVTFNQLAFWAFMTWLALVWFCPIFILAWRALAELNARHLTGKDAAPVNPKVPVIGQTNIAAHLRHRYGRCWKCKVRIMMVVGEEAEVEQAVPGLIAQQWLEGENTVLLWGGSAQAEPDIARISAWRKLRRRPLDGIVWAVNPTQTKLRETLDSVARQLQKQYEALKWKVPVWLWEIHSSGWEQKGRETQAVGCEFTTKSNSDVIQVSLTSLVEPLTERGMQQVLLNRQHSFLISLAQHLRLGGITRLNQLADTLRTGAAALPLAGMMFSLPLTPAAPLPRHGWLPDASWHGITRYTGQQHPERTGMPWVKTAQWCAGILLLLWAVGSLLSFSVNRHQMSEDRELVATAMDAHKPLEERLLSQYALQREIGRLQYRASAGAPWYSRFGLSQNNSLLNSLWASYTRINTPLIRDAAAQHLQQQLSAFQALPPASPLRTTQAKETYNLLKAYLMMAHPEKMEPAFYTQTMMKSWPQREGVNPGVWQGTGPALLSFYAQNLSAHPQSRINPDMRQVNAVRTSLLRQIGVNNAETTLYQEVLNQVSRDYADMTLSQMVNDIYSSKLFSTEEVVPGVFTRKAWEEEVEPALAKVVKSRRDEIDWVLSDSQHSVSEDVDPQVLKERLTARYFTDYASAWLNFLNSLQWQQAASLSDSIDQLTLMADVRQSPLIALMNTLAYQGKAGQSGEGLSDSLVKSAQDLLNTRKKPVIDQQAGAHGPLDDTFGPLLSLMEGTAGGQGNNNLSLQTFLTRITRVRLKLQQVTNAPDPQAMMQSLALTVFQGKAVDLTDTRDYGSLIAASLGQEWSGFGQAMFVQPMVQAWQQVLAPTAESINTQWQTEIVNSWNKAFNGRYPFVDRKSEASLPQMAQFLRTDTGNIVQFIQTRLGGILRKEGDNWVPDAMNSQGLTFNPEFLAALNELTRIANVAFNHGDVELHFELMGKPSRDVVESELVVDRQTLKYFNQMESWQTMTWPDNRWQPQTLLSWTSVKAGARLYGDFPGSWGFIRLLDKALVTELGDNTYRVAWITPDGLALNYMLRTELGKGPLALLDLRGFTLPARIFDAVELDTARGY